MNLAELNVKIGADISGFEKQIKELEAGIGKLGEKLKSAGEAMTQYVSLPLAAIGVASLKVAGDIEALQKGLTAVMGSAEAAGKEFELLKEVAKLPGLGLEEALQGSINLQAVGYEAEQSREILKGFGNALATVGKGKADLEGVITALSQMAAKGKISAEEINQIAERVPQIRKVMKDAFGTADTEALQKMGISVDQFVSKATAELRKLPPVTGGIKNAFENAGDGIKLALNGIGTAINKAFDIEGLLNKVAETISGLTTWFESLSSTTQKVILVIAGVVAAIGPMLVVFGAVAAAIPTIIAGFTLLAGPVGIIVGAIAALTIGLGAFALTSKDVTKEYQDQKAKVASLESSLTPLIARHDELAGKAKRSKEEQTELDSIIAQIAKTVPGAITQFDEYGRAMSVSTDKAKDFIEQQKLIAQAKNAEAIEEQIKKLKKLDEQLAFIKKRIADGFIEKALGGGTFGGSTTIKDYFTPEEKQAYGERASLLEQQKRGIQLYIDELKGIKPVVVENNDADAEGVTQTMGKIAQLEAEKKALQENAIGLISEESIAKSNDQIAALTEKIEHLKGLTGKKELVSVRNPEGSGWQNVGDRTIKPDNSIVENLKMQTEAVRVASVKLQQEMNMNAKSSLAFGESFDYAGRQIQSLEGYITALLQNGFTAFSPQVQDAVAKLESFKVKAQEVTIEVGQYLTSAFVALGDTIGSAISGGAGNLESFFNNILSIVSDFAGQFGKQLIAIGIGKMALTSLAGPASIAAGVALIALSKAAQSFASKGPKFNGGGATPAMAGRSYSGGNYTPAAKSAMQETGAEVKFTIDGPTLSGVLKRNQERQTLRGGSSSW